jgi:ABC-type transporter Mla maintaining outer membrane lipid asymmetry ATPase subunit MlaF
LSDKCVILVTHQIKCVNQCDGVLELREGSMGLYGDPKDILQNDNQRLLELLSSNEDDASKLFRIRSHSAKNILLKSSKHCIMHTV